MSPGSEGPLHRLHGEVLVHDNAARAVDRESERRRVGREATNPDDQPGDASLRGVHAVIEDLVDRGLQVDLHPALLEDACRVPTQRRPHPRQQRGPRLDQMNGRGRVGLSRRGGQLHTAGAATHHHHRVGLGDPPP